MKKITLLLFMTSLSLYAIAQTLGPEVTAWMLNSNGTTGFYYVENNSTPLPNNIEVNCQLVQYSNDFCYVNSTGIPAYTIGPYLDGNPSQGADQSNLFKIPRNPTPATGANTQVGLGGIGVLVNGVVIYNNSDGQSYQSQGVWNQDAIYHEKEGFDCAKGHPSPPPMGNPINGTYHHHQNPTAFDLDNVVISNICDLYAADGLYAMNSSQHSPLLGFAFDGYPVYGAFAYDNTNGSGAIVRMESSYQYKNITSRVNGPTLQQFPLGAYQEDFEFVLASGHLDEHNGRFAVTPEYPGGTYAYYTTIDANWNSYFPYIIGPTYYGAVEQSNLNGSVSINEPVTTYNPATSIVETVFQNLSVFPNPSVELITIQVSGMLKKELGIKLYTLEGKLVSSKNILPGSTICHFDTRTLYNGTYIISIFDGVETMVKKVLVTH